MCEISLAPRLLRLVTAMLAIARVGLKPSWGHIWQYELSCTGLQVGRFPPVGGGDLLSSPQPTVIVRPAQLYFVAHVWSTVIAV
jgi:hypothetical protein